MSVSVSITTGIMQIKEMWDFYFCFFSMPLFLTLKIKVKNYAQIFNFAFKLRNSKA